MKIAIAAHSFRSSVRDWAAETTSSPREVLEMALVRTVANKAQATYRRGDLLEKRRELTGASGLFTSNNSTSSAHKQGGHEEASQEEKIA